MSQAVISFDLPTRRLYSVSELTESMRFLLVREFSNIWVSGEVSGLKLAPSGHCYFTLKDGEAQIRCACWARNYRILRFKPKEGMAVLVRGAIDVYAPRGEYQLIVEAIEPQGLGALQAAFEELKKRLTLEGLFAPERKRPLPALPRRIGIVTSPAGAVIQDMLNILERRHPGLHIRIFPALVQGAGSLESVCDGIHYFSQSNWADVVIVARGGGSLEDLWTFNEEAVARAIAASRVPVISAIGHETDFTIADFAADRRAATPSEAAEIAVVTKQSLIDQVDALTAKLAQVMRYHLSRAGRRLEQQGLMRAEALVQRKINYGHQRTDELEARLRQSLRSILDRRKRIFESMDLRFRRTDLRLRFAAIRQRIERAESLLPRGVEAQIAKRTARLERISAKLDQLSPLKILERGYAVVLSQAGLAVKDPAAVAAEEQLEVRLAKGSMRVVKL